MLFSLLHTSSQTNNGWNVACLDSMKQNIFYLMVIHYLQMKKMLVCWTFRCICVFLWKTKNVLKTILYAGNCSNYHIGWYRRSQYSLTLLSWDHGKCKHQSIFVKDSHWYLQDFYPAIFLSTSNLYPNTEYHNYIAF
jgi:hypothetical protein